MDALTRQYEELCTDCQECRTVINEQAGTVEGVRLCDYHWCQIENLLTEAHARKERIHETFKTILAGVLQHNFDLIVKTSCQNRTLQERNKQLEAEKEKLGEQMNEQLARAREEIRQLKMANAGLKTANAGLSQDMRYLEARITHSDNNAERKRDEHSKAMAVLKAENKKLHDAALRSEVGLAQVQAAAEEERQEAARRLGDTEEELADLHRTNDTLSAEVCRLQNRIEVLMVEVSWASTERDCIATQLGDTEDELADSRKANNTLRDEVCGLKDCIGALEAEVSRSSAERDCIATQIRDTEGELRDTKGELADSRRANDTLRKQLCGLEDRIGALEGEVSRSSAERERIVTKLRDTEGELRVAREKNTALDEVRVAAVRLAATNRNLRVKALLVIYMGRLIMLRHRSIAAAAERADTERAAADEERRVTSGRAAFVLISAAIMALGKGRG